VDYITPKEASLKWGISERRIQKLCEEGRLTELSGSAKCGYSKGCEKTSGRQVEKEMIL